MKSKTTTNNKNIIKGQRVTKSSRNESSTIKKPKINSVFERLAEEGHEDFYNYLEWLGLAKDPHILILTSSHHYYFENEDLRIIKTVVNLKPLNNIKSIKDFLDTISNVIPDKCYFIGSFTDNKNQIGFFSSSNKSGHSIDGSTSKTDNSTGQWNSIMNMVYDIIDSRTNRYMSEKSVRLLIENTGLKILDITEFNGLTYFCTQKNKLSVE
jgi:hypothetical protein